MQNGTSSFGNTQTTLQNKNLGNGKLSIGGDGMRMNKSNSRNVLDHSARTHI